MGPELGPNSLIISFALIACMDFLQWNLSPLFLFVHISNVKKKQVIGVMSVTLTNVSV